MRSDAQKSDGLHDLWRRRSSTITITLMEVRYNVSGRMAIVPMKYSKLLLGHDTTKCTRGEVAERRRALRQPTPPIGGIAIQLDVPVGRRCPRPEGHGPSVAHGSAAVVTDHSAPHEMSTLRYMHINVPDLRIQCYGKLRLPLLAAALLSTAAAPNGGGAALTARTADRRPMSRPTRVRRASQLSRRSRCSRLPLLAAALLSTAAALNGGAALAAHARQTDGLCLGRRACGALTLALQPLRSTAASPWPHAWRSGGRASADAGATQPP
jgi:hypothetical protein